MRKTLILQAFSRGRLALRAELGGPVLTPFLYARTAA